VDSRQQQNQEPLTKYFLLLGRSRSAAIGNQGADHAVLARVDEDFTVAATANVQISALDLRSHGLLNQFPELAEIQSFRFHDLRHTIASWYMMNAGDLYELAKILGHANIKMTERYAKLGKTHIASTGNTAHGIWKLMDAVKGEREAAAV
jgi:integrase-like protein